LTAQRGRPSGVEFPMVGGNPPKTGEAYPNRAGRPIVTTFCRSTGKVGGKRFAPDKAFLEKRPPVFRKP
jgi:hypothetical protein